MKKITSLLLLTLFLLVCAGCDGHIKTLYLLKPNDPKPSWSISNTVISIQGNEDIAGIVQKVANDLNMKEEKANRRYTETKESSTFTMILKKSEKDVWMVNLIDFPSVYRSEQSNNAEKMILENLKKAQPRR